MALTLCTHLQKLRLLHLQPPHQPRLLTLPLQNKNQSSVHPLSAGEL
jgi:hypothetical protein